MMIKRKNENKYSGQALAIAMLVLVVSSLIGLSMYSRTTRDKALTLEERASAEALEVSDILLNNLTRFTVEELILALNNSYYTQEGEEFNEEDGVVLIENSENDNITRLFEELGLLEVTTISNLIDPLCPISTDLDVGGNEYQITLQKAGPDVGYEVRPGHVWTFPTRKVTISAEEEGSCELQLSFSEIGDPYAGFVLTRSYCEYDLDTDLPISCPDENAYTMEKYRYQNPNTGETNPDFLDDNWINLDPSSSDPNITIPLDQLGVPTEIRIKAIASLGSPGINVSYALVGDACPTGVNMYQVRATANCSGVYRGKEIVIPQRGHNVLFDYVYFSGM